jgi:NAD(P)-dependent dehydrogenase (short-subunit alcohol dehydrogenase family)
VTVTARSDAKGAAAVEDLRAAVPDAAVGYGVLELASLASVRAFADGFAAEHDRLDLLIANAGVMAMPFGLTEDGFETHLGTNHLGHFVLVARLLPLLRASAPARVVILSSGGHLASDIRWDDPSFAGGDFVKMEAYGQSKTANILHAVELERRYGPLGVHAYAVHPGMVRTDLGRHFTAEDDLVVLAQCGCGPADPVVDPPGPPGQGGDRVGPGHRVGDRLEEAPGDELGVLRCGAGVADPGRGHARRDQRDLGGGDRTGRGPGRDRRVERVGGGASTGDRGQRGVGGEVGAPDHGGERLPLRVGLAGECEPGLGGVGGVQVLGRSGGTAVAGAGDAPAGGGPLEHGLGRDRERGLDHGCLDQAAHPGAVALVEGHERGDRCVHAAVGVARTAGDAGLVVGVPGHPGHARDLLHGLGEAGAVAPRTGEASRGRTARAPAG